MQVSCGGVDGHASMWGWSISGAITVGNNRRHDGWHSGVHNPACKPTRAARVSRRFPQARMSRFDSEYTDQAGIKPCPHERDYPEAERSDGMSRGWERTLLISMIVALLWLWGHERNLRREADETAWIQQRVSDHCSAILDDEIEALKKLNSDYTSPKP